MALTSAGPSGFPSIIVLVLGQFLLQVFSWTTLNHYCTLQALTSRFQQMTLPPLLRKLILLDILGVLVKVIRYKQQNPIYWLNVTFVKKLCCSSESLRKDQRPSLEATRPPPCRRDGCSKHRCRSSNVSLPHALMMLRSGHQKFCFDDFWRDKHSTSLTTIWNLHIPTSLQYCLPSQHLMKKHLTGKS